MLDTLAALAELSNFLGRPDLDLAILGEGNTSAASGDGTFWVKPSGTELATVVAEQFVRVDLNRALEILDEVSPSHERVTAQMRGSVVGEGNGMPSMETLMHAVCISLGQASFVGHTHPTAVNALTCSERFHEIYRGRIFPDEVVVCGRHPLLLPYRAPGFPLALAVRDGIVEHKREHGTPPKLILLQNHGLVALGSSAGEVRATTLMAVKAARVLAGAMSFGAVNRLGDQEADDLDRRPDEQFRKDRISEAS